MHFFWRGDMPHYSPPLPFRRGRAGCPFMLARGQTARAQRGVAVVCAGRRAPGRAQGHDRGRARWLGGRRPCPAWGSRTCTLAGGPSPVPDAGVASGRGLLRARNIRYVTIKPMTKYCPVFMLSLAGVPQDRNSGLVRNYDAAI